MEKLIFRREDPRANFNVKVQVGEVKVTKSVVPVHTLIKDKPRKKIVKKVFGNEEPEFENFLVQLEPIQTWKEAYQKIEEELAKRKIRAEEEEAVLFANIVYRRYYPYDDEVEIE